MSLSDLLKDGCGRDRLPGNQTAQNDTTKSDYDEMRQWLRFQAGKSCSASRVFPAFDTILTTNVCIKNAAIPRVGAWPLVLWHSGPCSYSEGGSWLVRTALAVSGPYDGRYLALLQAVFFFTGLAAWTGLPGMELLWASQSLHAQVLWGSAAIWEAVA